MGRSECGDVHARCWVLTEAGLDVVRPARPVPRSEETRRLVDLVLARFGEVRG